MYQKKMDDKEDAISVASLSQRGSNLSCKENGKENKGIR